ncbi:MAG: arsenate reductase ArsC [Actinobacteria bacterium]|nr:arsenate reductase ArsC [Actinomycetota bacterium]
MTASSDRVVQLTDDQRLLVARAAARLAAEFDGTFNVQTIERYLASSQEALQSSARFTMWLPILIERLTRDRLRAVARLETDRPERPAVLFLCAHNAGRSKMAAAWMRTVAGDRVEVFSAGTDPGVEVNRVAAAAMAEVGVDIADELPQPWTDEIVRAVDVIVTMGCGDACPVHAGKRYEDWDLPDPSGQPLEVVRGIRDDIRTRVELLLADLERARA